MDDLLTDFISETRETLEAIAGEIVAWEADSSDTARLDAIFRFVHTVKGSCGFLNLPRLQRLSHAAEDALAEVRSGTRVADAALVSAVLAVIDRIGELTDAMESGQALPDKEEPLLIAALAPQAAPVAAPPRAPRAQPSRGLARSIRLPVELLDRMMAGVSDMVLARNDLARRLRGADTDSSIGVAFERLSVSVGEMREAITRTRMARIETLFSVLPRMVRDLSAQLGKTIALQIDGGDVELDREMIEMIRDPLAHIVRNACDHGIETPRARRDAGKKETGRLIVSARQSGNQIVIEVVDDGKGIDAERLLQKALANGLLTPEEAAGMVWSRKLDLIFEPGLSTAAAVTEVSGRGVGMDVVRANVERIGGTVEVDSRPGYGLRLAMRVPLTLTIIPALTVSSGALHFAIPRTAIGEIVRPTGAAVRLERIGGGLVARIRGTRLPVVELSCFMGLPACGLEPALLVVLRAGNGTRYALGVDAVHDHEELVVKPAAPALMASGIYAGTTLPDNSRPMLLLDIAGVAAAAGILPAEEAADAAPEDIPALNLVQTLLFRDLDRAVRAVRLPLVERIEDVAVASVVEAGGARLLAHEGVLSPLHAAGPLPDAARMRVLRLSDGAVHLAYAIDEVIDVVLLGTDVTPVRIPGPVAGVLLHEGAPVELLDAHWLFSSVAAADAGTPPLCLIADEDGPWAREVLAPLLAAAGYRTAFAGEPLVERVAVVIAHGPPPAGVDAPVVELRGTPERPASDDGSVYRYDRGGLIEALRARTAAG